MKMSLFAAAAAVALVLALGLAARTYSQHSGFRKVVRESLATSEGYDQQFINLVNNLENVLTSRASFPYPGGKDPMTGRRREVAAAPVLAEQSPKPAPAAAKTAVKLPAKAPGSALIPAPPKMPEDRVRITAIIADDYGQHTAIVMDGERSLSVDVGDMVGNRRVLRISSKELTMEDDKSIFIYNLSGGRSVSNK